jgi:hypothetical protein
VYTEVGILTIDQQPILAKGNLEDVDKYFEMMTAGKLPGRAVLKVN